MTQEGHPELGDNYSDGLETYAAFTSGTDVGPVKQNLLRTREYTAAHPDTVVSAAVSAFCPKFPGVR